MKAGKLSDRKVLAILYSNKSYRAIKREHGSSLGEISKIKRGLRYQHISRRLLGARNINGMLITLACTGGGFA
jgi:hypothetical protein